MACGLEGKRTTSLENEAVRGPTVAEVGEAFVQEMASALDGVDGVEVSEFEDDPTG